MSASEAARSCFHFSSGLTYVMNAMFTVVRSVSTSTYWLSPFADTVCRGMYADAMTSDVDASESMRRRA